MSTIYTSIGAVAAVQAGQQIIFGSIKAIDGESVTLLRWQRKGPGEKGGLIPCEPADIYPRSSMVPVLTALLGDGYLA